MSSVTKNGPAFLSRVRGLLHGVAFGDAVGAPIEKLSAAQIREKYGRVESIYTEWYRNEESVDARKGRVRGNGIATDDTFMTLALMEIYNEEKRHLDAWDMANGMVRQIAWRTRWIPEMQRECALIERLFYPEKWIFQRHQLSSCDPRQGGIGNMVNCGAAMYIAPVGVVNACNSKAAYDEAIAFASGHQQSYGLEAAGVLAGAVAAAFVPGTDISDIVKTAHDLAKDGTRAAISEIVEAAENLRQKGAEHAEIVAVFHEKIARFSPMGDELNQREYMAGSAIASYQPSRFLSIEELPIALGFIITSKGDFRQAILDGINSGRDTDSIGVMIGAILGAMHGETVIDPSEATQLDKVNRLDLDAEAGRFCETAGWIMNDDRARAHDLEKARIVLLENDDEFAKPIEQSISLGE